MLSSDASASIEINPVHHCTPYDQQLPVSPYPCKGLQGEVNSKGRRRYYALPYPPAVGVRMMIASPASSTVASQPASFSTRPSLRRTAFSPTWPSVPPSSPNGGTSRWPDRIVHSIFSRKRMVRTTPSPAAKRPLPPEPLRM